MRWILIITVLFFIGCEKKDETKKLQSQIDELKVEINSLKQKNIDITNNDANIKNLEEKIKLLNDEIFDNEDKFSKIKQEIKDLNNSIVHIPTSTINCKGYFKPTVFITTKKTKIYNSKGEVVKEWDKCTTFTSYMEKNGKLRVTGIFVHLKWQNALSKDWWIDVKDVARKFKDKNES